jgi:hypothetical protein
VIAATPLPISFRILAATGALAVGSLWWVIDLPSEIPSSLSTVDVVLFVLAAAVMERLPIRLPDGRSVPTSLAVLGSAAVLGASPAVLGLIGALAWTTAHLVDGEGLDIPGLLARTAGAWVLSGVAAFGTWTGPGIWRGSAPVETVAWVHVGAAITVTAAILFGVPLLSAVAQNHAMGRFLPRRTAEMVRANALVGTSVAATAVLGALVHPVLEHWTLPTMLLPLLAARVGLDRYAVAARAYDQTLRAMSRLPEQLASVEAGHGVRVAQLAGSVAMELGLDADTVGDVVRAAHLHEVGRIKLEHDTPVTKPELAAEGASVIRKVKKLARVADMVAGHGQLHDFRPTSEATARGARIVAACCEIDRYAPDPISPEQRHEVVVRLVRDIGDLEVVAALTRVLDRDAGLLEAGRS